jgi:hypothetical protein
MQSSQQDTGSSATGIIKKIIPYVLIIIGFAAPFITTIILSTNVGLVFQCYF